MLTVDEAAATLKDEDVQVESWFKIEISGEKYLLWYLRARSFRRVFEVSRELKHPIDKFHYDVMEAITAPNIIAEPLIDMRRGWFFCRLALSDAWDLDCPEGILA